MAQLQGRTGKIYTTEKELSHGGEGTIYTVQGDSSIVIKQYHAKNTANTPEKRAALEKKLIAMVEDTDFDFHCNGVLRFAWPSDLVYDTNGTFVGFVMPYVRDAYGFHELWGAERQRKFKHYDYQRSIAVSFNLAQAINYVHDHGYVMGDLNVKNFLFDKMCNVIVLDVDSFDLSDKLSDPRCKCCVGTPNYLAPELQIGGDLSRPSAKFTRESDCFSMALLIFQFLMDGAHPFNAPKIDTGTDYCSSSGFVSMQKDIASGSCPYVRQNTGKQVPPYAPDFNMLPAALQKLFQRTFDYTQDTAMRAIHNRPTAAEFAFVLHQFYTRTDKITCSVNPRHIYLSRMSSCPFCAMEARRANALQPASAAACTGSRPSCTSVQPAPKKGFAKLLEGLKNLFN